MNARTRPRFLFLQTNQRCNLKCTHCEYWRLNDEDSANYLSFERRTELIREFAALGGEALVTCGGEPMLDLVDYLGLMSAARAQGLRALSVTNGTVISSLARAHQVLEFGPSEITISFDHWRESEHDRLRGCHGAWQRAVRAVRWLRLARQERGSHTPIYAMALVSEDTWRTLWQFFEFAFCDLGVDKLKLNFAQPTFQHRGGGDEYFAGARISDVAGCLAEIRKCDERWEIRRNPEWLRAVEDYLTSAARCKSPLLGWAHHGGTETAICNSYDRNIMIDLYGRARLCFSDRFPHVQLHERGDLAAFWYGSSLPIREKMIGCRQFCGISHSVRKEPSTLKVLP